MHYIAAIFTVFLGCCSNVFFLELLVKAVPGCGNLVTFAQFVFISVKGFIFETRFGTRKSHIPLRNYAELVVLFFVVSIINNYALNFNISMPLHMIFRSGSLIANMLLGIVLLNKRYSLREYISIVMISIGIFMCTMASSKEVKTKVESTPESEANELVQYARWITGILMLTFALFLAASMGIFQEKMYRQFGKFPGEALYYNHVLGLPAFVFLYSDLYSQIDSFNNSQPYDLIVFSVPILWLYLLGNTLTQYVCISSVFVLTTECTSLTVNLVVTLRKFVSLILSIIYFQNPFTTAHWIGTILVFVGTFMFSNITAQIKAYMNRNKEAKKTN